jgi:hypothetical protein
MERAHTLEATEPAAASRLWARIDETLVRRTPVIPCTVGLHRPHVGQAIDAVAREGDDRDVMGCPVSSSRLPDTRTNAMRLPFGEMAG